MRGSFFLFALFAISSSLCLQPANADDWGYEQTEKIDDSVGSVKELDAVAGQLDSPLLKMDDKELVKESPAKQESKAPEIKDQKLKRAIDYWLQLYGLVAPIDKNGKLIEGGDLSKNLSEKQKIRFAHYLAKNKHTDPATLAVVDYWPDLEKRIKDLDQRGNYRLLFRALLRVRAQSKTIHSEERGIILESLGPEMIAVPGDPPLTDEALSAYADMTCFLYEKKNPGKTVDADDNRELFSLVLKGKFKDAPSQKDKIAMANFPLNWAKFRILYSDASESDRTVLLKKLANADGSRGITVSNRLLEKVLSEKPWREIVLGSKNKSSM